MSKYARDSDIDLDEAYGGLIDKHSRMQRNIRTKTWMNSAHHCEDLECGGGAPKTKCVLKLHFAFCLAPVVDEDPDSPTCGDVVIHRERFAAISPSGCAEHPYNADFNLNSRMLVRVAQTMDYDERRYSRVSKRNIRQRRCRKLNSWT
jgi:hypothetical protein